MVLIITSLVISGVSASDVNTTEDMSTSSMDDVTGTVNVDLTQEECVNENNLDDSKMLCVSSDKNLTAYDDVDSGENVLTDDDKSEILRANDVNIDFNSSNEDLIVNSNHANNSGEDILGLTNQDNNMLNIAPETKLTANNEITVTTTDNQVTIVFTLISIDESYYHYSWKCIKANGNVQNLKLNGWGSQTLASSFSTGSSGSFTVSRSSGNPYNSYMGCGSWIPYVSDDFLLPSSLPEVDTSVSVTNPSVKYNSGSFSVSGKVTADDTNVNEGVVKVNINVVNYNGNSHSINRTAKAQQTNNKLNDNHITPTTNTIKTLTSTSWNNRINPTLLDSRTYKVTDKYNQTSEEFHYLGMKSSYFLTKQECENVKAIH